MSDKQSPACRDDGKAWRQTSGWKPKNPCHECEGTGMGQRKTYQGDELIDWDDCWNCKGTGEEPKK